jgi:hypothetical protein
MYFFSSHVWKFTNSNIQELWEKINEDDKKLFDFNIGGLDWDKYLYNYVRGVRLYLMKDDPSTIPQGIARQRRYINVHTLQYSEQSTVKIERGFVVCQVLLAVTNLCKSTYVHLQHVHSCYYEQITYKFTALNTLASF